MTILIYEPTFVLKRERDDANHKVGVNEGHSPSP